MKQGHKSSKGTVLLITLIINSVIAMLVLANLKSQLIATKALQVYKKKQEDKYALKATYQNLIEKKILSTNQCLHQTQPKFHFPIGDIKTSWCIDEENNSYRIWDGGIHCCLKTADNKYAHFYYVEFKHFENRVVSTVVKGEKSNTCHCLETSGITEGIIYMK